MSKSTKNIQYVIPIGNAKEIARNNKSDLVIYGKKGQILSTISFRSMAKA